MAYRFTNTDKWSDLWFMELRPMEKLLFNYLCDNCDIAGFIEVIPRKWAFDIGTDVSHIEGACKGLARGLIYSKSGDCVFLRTFLKHQKNLPLNPDNKAHIGILKRFNLYKERFDIEDINEFLERNNEGACKGLQSPTGIGIGKGIEKGTKEKKEKKEQEPKTEFEKFNAWLKDSCPNVSRLRTQITEEQMMELIEKYGKQKFIDILMQMENKYDLNKKYVSVYLTARNWLKNDFNKQPNEQRPKYYDAIN